MSGRTHIARILVALAASAVAPAASAEDAWTKNGANWYTPKSYKPGEYTTAFTLNCNDGAAEYVTVRFNSKGELDTQSASAIDYAVRRKEGKMATMNEFANLAKSVTALVDKANETDARFETLATNLDDAFLKILQKLKTIEEKDKDGNTVKTLTDPVVDTAGSSVSYTVEGSDNIATDGLSIEFSAGVGNTSGDGKDRSNSSKALRLFGYGDAQKTFGMIPFVSNDGALDWSTLEGFTDKETIEAVKKKDGDFEWKGLSLYGWNGGGNCAPTVGEMMSGADKANEGEHLVLTRLAGKDCKSASLHYTKIGQFAGGNDNKGKYLRTSESDGAKSDWEFPLFSLACEVDSIELVKDEKTGKVTLKPKADKIDIKNDDDETTHSLTIKETDGKTIVLQGAIGGYEPDGVSLGTTSNTNGKGKMTVLGFGNAKSGDFAVKSGADLCWRSGKDIADGKGVSGEVVADGDQEWPRFGLANWAAPDGTCGQTIAGMLMGSTGNEASSHRVLTRQSDGDGSLHYAAFGTLAGGSGNVGKYLRTATGGTSVEWAFPVTKIKNGGGLAVETDDKTGEVTLTVDGSVVSVESQATTSGETVAMTGQRVVFKAAEDSCVKVDVTQGQSTNEIVVTIGCYYK